MILAVYGLLGFSHIIITLEKVLEPYSQKHRELLQVRPDNRINAEPCNIRPHVFGMCMGDALILKILFYKSSVKS